MTELDLHVDGTSFSLQLRDGNEQRHGRFRYLPCLLENLITLARLVD